MTPYIILLRGINVGGKNKVSMTELKVCLEEQGFAQVKTYINSGNVLLQSDHSRGHITDLVEKMLPQKFKLDSILIKVLVLSYSDLHAIIEQAPKGFGTEPTKYHSDAIFLIDITAEEAMAVFSPREGVDRIWPGHGVIYSQRLSAERVKSRLSKIIGTPAYKNMTIRSWGTTLKLLTMLDEQTA